MEDVSCLRLQWMSIIYESRLKEERDEGRMLFITKCLVVFSACIYLFTNELSLRVFIVINLLNRRWRLI